MEIIQFLEIIQLAVRSLQGKPDNFHGSVSLLEGTSLKQGQTVAQGI
jgi:hypothetical protein